MAKGGSKYTDRARYCAAVLHLHGYSYAEVAAILTRYGIATVNRARVSGLILRLGIRTKVDREERQAQLDALKSERLDGGILSEHVFRAL